MQINDGNYSPTYTELTPVQMSENTEVKVPVVSSYPTNGQSYPTNGQQFSIKTEDSFSEYPTESFVMYDSNDVQFGPNLTESHYVQLQNLFRGLPKSMFIQSIKKNYASCEVRMEEVRSCLFMYLKETDGFPYPDCQMKKRIETRNGVSLSDKLAADIQTMMSLCDGGD